MMRAAFPARRLDAFIHSRAFRFVSTAFRHAPLVDVSSARTTTCVARRAIVARCWRRDDDTVAVAVVLLPSVVVIVIVQRYRVTPPLRGVGRANRSA